MLPTDPLEYIGDVLRPMAEPRYDRRGEMGDRVDDGRDPVLPTGCELVVYEVSRPGLVRLDRPTTNFTQLRLDPPLRDLGSRS